MDPGQTFPILPSNATHQTSVHAQDSFVDTRILQPRSSNSQTGHYFTGDISGYKVEKSPANTNVYAGYNSRHGRHAQQARQRRRELDYTGEWKALFNYAMQNENFRKYRENQLQKDKPQKPAAMKWPLDLEEAFFRALVVWQPMGREKKQVDGHHKRMGRNELIAKYISDDTGLRIDRKRVSSHIQVVGNFFKGDRIFMQYLRQPSNSRSSTGRLSSHRNHATLTAQRMMGHRSAEDYGAGPESTPQLRSHRPLTESSIPQRPTIFDAHEFSMYIADSNDKKGWVFTRYSRNVRVPPLKLENTANWQGNLPLLSQAIKEAGPNMDAIYAESTIALTGEALRPEKDRLSIASVFSSDQDLGRVFDLECRTSFYEHGVLKPDFQYKDVIEQETAPNGKKLFILRFGSAFWARRFVDLSSRLRHKAKLQAMGANNDQSENKAHQEAIEEGVREQIKGIDAVQEIFGYAKGEAHDSNARPQRLMIINWKFRQAREGEFARTTFKRVIIPSEEPDATGGSSEYEQQTYDPNMTFDFSMDDFGHDIFKDESFDHNNAATIHSDLDTLSSAAALGHAAYSFDGFSMAGIDLPTAGGYQEIQTSNVEEVDLRYASVDPQYSMPEFTQNIVADFPPTYVSSQAHVMPGNNSSHTQFVESNLRGSNYANQPIQYFAYQQTNSSAPVFPQYSVQPSKPSRLQLQTYSNYNTTAGRDYLSPHSASHHPDSAYSQQSSFDEGYASQFAYSRGPSQSSIFSPTHQQASGGLTPQPNHSFASNTPHSQSHATTPHYVFTPQNERHQPLTPNSYCSQPPTRMNSFAQPSLTRDSDASMHDSESQSGPRQIVLGSSHPPLQLDYNNNEATSSTYYNTAVTAGGAEQGRRE